MNDVFIAEVLDPVRMRCLSPEKHHHRHHCHHHHKNGDDAPKGMCSYSVMGTKDQPSHLRILRLNAGVHSESTVYRLEKGWILHFTLGPSLLGKTVHIFTNHPPSVDVPFGRGEYRELPWQQASSTCGDDSDIYAEICCLVAGSFNYFFVCEESGKTESNGSGYFLIDPVLKVGPKDEQLPLDCIQCQTVLSKCLGPFSEWEDRLRVSYETGYSVIHFTPVQELGKSNSAYCIKDQLCLGSTYIQKEEETDMEDVGRLVDKMKTEWKVLSICDIVLNHSANESPWLMEAPECAYNLVNSPHLRPAYLLDRSLWHFTKEIMAGKWEMDGLTAQNITSEAHIMKMRSILETHIIPRAKIEEFYMLDIEELVEQFRDQAMEMGICSKKPKLGDKLKIVQDPLYVRYGSTVDMEMAMRLFNVDRGDMGIGTDRVVLCCADFRAELAELNREAKHLCDAHLKQAVNCVLAGQMYFRIQADGPKWKAVTTDTPISNQYFTHPVKDTCLADDEELMNTDKAAYIMAHNGWVMNDDPLRNFAEPPSMVYLCRELISWGDSVKLKYGNGPEDNPRLWAHMKKYVEDSARFFHGLRLDNCHSTPIHVGEYLLDAARKVRPDLYVVAELFTSSELKDNIFVNRLGITSLIREAMSAWDSHELGRLVYRYGGESVGAFIQPTARPFTPSIAHALFLDQTHDNKCPVQVRSVYDLLPSAALVSMACCATGSTRGYDELVPVQLDVVTESRFYKSWAEASAGSGGSKTVTLKSGIIAAKKALNALHQQLGESGYSQVYVDQVDKNIVAVTRHCPHTHQSVILVAYTAFEPPLNIRETGFIPPLCIPGVVDEIIFEARLVPKPASPVKEDNTFISGLSDYACEIREHVRLFESDMAELSGEAERDLQVVDFCTFTPGSVIAFKVSLNSSTKAAILKLRTCLAQFGYRMRSYSGSHINKTKATDFRSICQRMSLADMNTVLYRCNNEEKDDGKGFGVYNIPDFGDLVYCGLHGFIPILAKIREKNDLGHPLCENLRNGDWMPSYIGNRLLVHSGTKELGKWFGAVFDILKTIPRYLIPCYFDAIIFGAYTILLEITWNKMSEFVKTGSPFVKALGLGSVQMCGQTKSACLPILSPNLDPPLPPTVLNEETGKREQACITLAAGLPHFSIGCWRSWGRDTFIAMRGLLLITGRFQEARFIILAYAGCLRHGLIPNLLSGGTRARYNCRDAVWWWLQCIQDYCAIVPDGHKILKDKVSRLYPSDDSQGEAPGFFDQPLEDVIFEAIQRHFEGITFRERNPGSQIDSDMRSDGFNNSIGVDPDTGFVFGGNEYNCGTWMDKMGSSDLAGNKGKPATPRDGSAVELVGLCKSALRWLIEMHDKGLYSYSSVQKIVKGETVMMSYKEWDDKIQKNFEKHFWINRRPKPAFEPAPELINKRGIYKDTHNATQFWTNYQLRCNFPVAMVVAPELFTPDNAWTALEIAEHHLLGPLGMKTLDPSDWAYRGNYDNSNRSADLYIANGYNYHQGPEWLWPLGYFLRAKLYFAAKVSDSQYLQKTVAMIKSTLSRHYEEIQQSPWGGLPELTNADGKFCADSSPTQAWSMSSVLEVMYDLHKLAQS